jgi:Tfp pilus assembly protein PilF
MRWNARIAAFALFAGACAQTMHQDRIRELNEDGAHLLAHGSYAHARETYEAALALQPNDPDILFHLASCHDRLGQGERAEKIYRQCLQSDAKHADCRHALVVLLANSGRRTEADALVQDWMRREPKRASAYVEDGWLLMQDGDLPGARGRLQQGVTLEPRNRQALVQLGQLYEKLGYPDRALVMYERALEVDPDQPDVAAKVKTLHAEKVGPPRPE